MVVIIFVDTGGFTTSYEEERAGFSTFVCLCLCGLCLYRFPLPLGIWDRMLYFIVALPEPSINLFYSFTALMLPSMYFQWDEWSMMPPKMMQNKTVR